MFKEVEEYMKLSREERRKHLRLDNECIEIGGLNSTYYKGLLAHYLKTKIPTRHNVYLCHACNNHKCSNPDHLYWGSQKDNMLDSKESGTWKNFYDRMTEKYGVEKTKKILSEAGKKGGKKGGGSNKLTNDQIKIKLDLLKELDLSKYGWVSKASNILNLSHTQTRRFVDKYYNTYKR